MTINSNFNSGAYKALSPILFAAISLPYVTAFKGPALYTQPQHSPFRNDPAVSPRTKTEFPLGLGRNDLNAKSNRPIQSNHPGRWTSQLRYFQGNDIKASSHFSIYRPLFSHISGQEL